MSDQSPPPKPKPGSLRDRIAAFEKQGTSPAPAGPPPTRPKPGGLQWKPRPPSPPTSPDHVQSSDRKPPSTGGMSASDAMESIGRAGSLKERMAALQGKGAFGGPPPPIAPKPNVERPNWKPPPVVPAPASSEADATEVIDTGGRATSRSPPPRTAVSPSPENRKEGDAIAQYGDGGDPDPEEEERQRRAAIAARMARLGGARLGMGPPVFAPKPVVRKPEPGPPVEEGQSAVVEESSEALVTSPPDLPAAISPLPEGALETERKDELELPPTVPTRTPGSMPMPAGPRRAAPPRKKPSKNAPTATLPEPPVEEPDSVATPDGSATTADHATRDPSAPQKRTVEAIEVVEVSHDEHDSEQCSSAPVLTVFREPAGEPETQEAEEEPVESAGSHVEEQSMHTAADDQYSEAFEADDGEEETRRQRVAAKLSQMGAFNPLAGPPPVPVRHSWGEPAFVPSKAPLDVEDEVNVDTEESGVTVPPPLAVPPRRDTVESHVETDQDDPKVEVGKQVPGHCDGDGHDGPPLPKSSEDHPTAGASVHDVGQQAPGVTFTHAADIVDVTGTAPVCIDVQQDGSQGGTAVTRVQSTTAEMKCDVPRDVVTSPSRMTRPMPPPPVNLRSKPTPPSSPPISSPAKVAMPALRVDDEECPPSPNIPPRPIPPPGRSSSMTEDVLSPPPRRSIPPPQRRTTLASPPSSPPPVPTSPRPVNRERRPDTPPIITALAVQGQAHPEELAKETKMTETDTATPRPDASEDEESVRRRTIAERMARLGGIRFGGPPPMNPLSRPPLPAAPPPTSIPPDDSEQEIKDSERGLREEDEAERKQRIAAKLAGMGGMKLGILPTALARHPITKQEDSENEDAIPPVPVPAPSHRPPPSRKPPPSIHMAVEQEPEQAGGGSRGTSDDGVQVEAEESEIEEVRYSDAEVPVGSGEEEATASRLMQTAEVLPTPPPRIASHSPPSGRPPIPMIPTSLLGRKPSASATVRSGSGSVVSSRQASVDETSAGETPTMSESALHPQSEYVMVEAENPEEDEVAATAPSPPRRRSTRGGPARGISALPPVPPPSAIDPPEALSGSAQWELTSIPQGPEFGEGSELASSRWSEDSTAVHVPGAASVLASSPPGSRSALGKVVSSVSVAGSGTGTGSVSGLGSGRRSLDQQPQLTTDELMTIWGKTGVRVVEAAMTLYEKSKRALVGDGSHAGFVRAVLGQVPGVVCPGATAPTEENEWGYMVYSQMGGAVQRRVSEIMPGDVIAIWDAKFKGHKGLHTYTQTVGASTGGGEGGATGSPLVGIVSEFDVRKSKVRVWQANQHVGQQTVENVSYRLDDLKSGQVKVYRVLEA